MAKAVNIKFVIALGVSLAVIVGGVGGVIYWRKHRNADPAVLQASAETKEKAGDMVEAAKLYLQAAAASSERHRGDADKLYVKAGDLLEQLSKSAKTRTDAVMYFQTSADAYRRAALENAQNKDVNEKALEDSYLQAQYFRSAAAWADMEKVATRLIKFESGQKQPSIKPYLYRARANFERLQTSTAGGKTPTDKDFEPIEADAKRAMELDKDSGEALAFYVRVMGQKAGTTATSRSGGSASAVLQDPVYKKEMADLKQMLLDFLAKHEADPEASEQLANHLLNDYYLREYAVQRDSKLEIPEEQAHKELGEVITYVTAAYKSDKTKLQRGTYVSELYAQLGEWEKAEGFRKQVITDNPDNAEAYYYLADFYRERGKYPEAVANFKEVLSHLKIGSGIEAFKNENMENASLQSIAWCNLEMADAAGPATEKGAGYLKETAEYTDKMRSKHAPNSRGSIDLLDGRIQLLKRNLPQAIASLKSAETNLANTRRREYVETKFYLAQANRLMNPPQLGLALKYIKDAIDAETAMRQIDWRLMLLRAQLLVQTGEYTEAQTIADSIIMAKLPRGGKLPETIVNMARQIKSASMVGLGQGELAKEQIENIGSTRSIIQQARMQMISADYEGAAADAKRALEREASSSPAEIQEATNVLAVALSKLSRKDEAIEVVTKALAKYPGNTTFEVLKARFSQPEGTDPLEMQKQVIASISDEFTRYGEMARLHRAYSQYDQELEAIGKAEAAIGDLSTPGARDKQGTVIEQRFSAASVAAVASRDPKDREKYWGIAQETVQKAETLNIDGVTGKFFRGRLEMARTASLYNQYKEATTEAQKTAIKADMEKTIRGGLQLLEQAVAQRPEYAIGHIILARIYADLLTFDTTDVKDKQRYMRGAIDEIEQAHIQAPTNLEAIRLGIVLLTRKSDDESMRKAKEYLQTGLKIAPRDPTLSKFGDLLADQGLSIKRREEAYKRDPTDSENALRLALLYRANQANDKEALKKAIALVLPLSKKKAQDMDLLRLLGALLIENGKASDKREDLERADADARQLFEPMLKSEKPADRYAALIAMSELARLAENQAGAINFLQEAIKIQPDGTQEAEYALANLYYESGYATEARELFQSILTKSKDATLKDNVFRRMIETEIRVGNYDVAEKMLAELFAKRPTDVQGLLLRGFMNVLRGRREPALADINKVLTAAEDPTDSSAQYYKWDAMYYRGMANARLPGGDVAAAERDLRAAGEHDRTEITSRVLLAEVYAKTQRYAEAAVKFQEVIKKKPDLMTARTAYADFLMTLAEIQKKLPADSQEEFAATIRALNPMEKLVPAIYESYKMRSDITWGIMYGNALVLRGDIQFAHDPVFTTLYKERPNDPRVAEAYLGSLLRIKDYTKAIEIAGKAIETFGTQPVVMNFYVKRSSAHAALRHTEEAGKDLDAAIARAIEVSAAAKNYSPFLNMLAQATALVPAELTAERLRIRWNANGNETATAAGLVHMLSVLKKPAEAVEVADKAMPTLAPTDVALRAFLLRESALVRYQSKQYPAAAKDFEELLKIDPSDVESLNNYAFMLADAMKKPKEAIEYAQRAISVLATNSTVQQVASSSANVFDTMGWAKSLNGQDEEALMLLKKSVNIQPMASAYLHLARVYQKLKRLPEARQAVDEGVKLARINDPETRLELEPLQLELNKSAGQ